MNNIIVIYHIDSEEPRIIVKDAANPADPAWNPPGHAQLHINAAHYNTLPHQDSLEYLKTAIAIHRVSLRK